MWRVWYADGTCIKSEECDLFALPGLGVQVIMQAHPVTGRWAQMGHDFYTWQDDSLWVGVDAWGLFDYLQQPGPRKVLTGRTIANEAYEEVYRRAEADATLPPRSILRHGEPRP